MFYRPLTRLQAILTITAVLVISGCGGGEIATLLAGVGSGGTGGRVVLGVLTGFGSLIVDGVRRDDSMATYMSDEDQGTPTAIASTNMTLGHSVELSLDANDAATTVVVSPALVGTVTSVSPSGITVLGVTVTINRNANQGPVTALVGYSSPTSIQIGDRVVVYGVLKTDNQGSTSLQATLIAQKTSGTGVRLTGFVAQYNATAGSFVINNQTVTIGSAALSPASTSLANGQLVTVWSNSAPIANKVTANTIRIKDPLGTNGTLTLSGLISGYTGAASFKISNVTVDAANATISPSGSTLADNQYIVVTGKYDAAANKVTANSVAVYAPAASNAVELHGSVLNFASALSFTVRGVVVDATNAAIVGGTGTQLTNGVYVEVFGSVLNNVVKATTLQIVSLTPQNAPAGAMMDLLGTITSYDKTTGNYTMSIGTGAALTGKTTASIFFDNGMASNFAVGQAVNVRGAISNGVLSTSVVSFPATLAPTGPGTAHVEGVAYNITPVSFMLNGLTIHTNGSTSEGSGAMGNGMMPGGRITVDVQDVDGQYVAKSIRPQGGS